MDDHNEITPSDLETAQRLLEKVGFDEAALQSIMSRLEASEHPKRIAYALAETKKVGLLDTENASTNIDAIFNHQDHLHFALIIKHMNQTSLPNTKEAQPIFDAALKYQDNTKEIAKVLRIMMKRSSPNHASRQAKPHQISRHEKPTYINQSDENLKYVNSIFQKLITHPSPWDAVEGLQRLANAGILEGEAGQTNIDALFQKETLLTALTYFDKLFQNNFLPPERAQTQFNELMQYTNLLVGSPEIRALWGRVPGHTLTAAHWNRLIQICRANNQINLTIGDRRLREFINQNLIPRAAHIQNQQAFNRRQNTHTASIHRTVSESATRLKEHYQEKIEARGLNHILQDIKNWVDEQPERDVEKRAIQQLVNSPFNFTDQGSQVTTKQLLALSWLAIHDNETRTATLEDAEDKFLKGLYDINRAYIVD